MRPIADELFWKGQMSAMDYTYHLVDRELWDSSVFDHMWEMHNLMVDAIEISHVESE
jgi:hypothetical protein